LFKLLVAFKVLGGCFPFVVIGFTIYELKNKIIELVKIQLGKEKETMKTEIKKTNKMTDNNKKIELVADMGIYNGRAANQKEQAIYICRSHQTFLISIYFKAHFNAPFLFPLVLESDGLGKEQAYHEPCPVRYQLAP